MWTTTLIGCRSSWTSYLGIVLFLLSGCGGGSSPPGTTPVTISFGVSVAQYAPTPIPSQKQILIALRQKDSSLLQQYSEALSKVLIPHVEAAPPPAGVASVKVIITGPSMAPMVDTVNVSAAAVVTRRYAVPSGASRNFFVQAFANPGGKGKLLSHGNARAHLYPGVPVTLSVPMTPVVDATPPVITLLGVTPVTIAQGSVYTDAGATALDNVDGNITANIVTVNNVNTAVPGTYTVTYNVSDAAGNPATQVTRTVNVTLLDITPPVITLLGVTPVTIAQGSVYTDAGATALDNVDGNITANIVTVNNVNTAAVGTYSVTYNVSDAAGNAANQVTRTVNVSPAMSFRQIFPSPSAGTLRDLAWNNVVGAGGVLVAVGDGGAYSSLDGGVTWTQTLATPGVTPATPISTTLFAVSWGAPGFVAVGQNGAIYSSANGTTWARQISGTITNLTAVTWGAAAGKYVAIGSAGKLLTSPDGVTWTVSATPAPGGNGHLTYGLGLFIGVQGSAIITSVDGLTWTAATVSPPAGQWFVDVIFTGTSFIAVGNSVMYTSATGTNWAPIATPPPLDVWSEVVSDGGTNLIVLASFGAYYFSADGGGTWSPAALIQPGIFGGSFGAVWNGNQFHF